MSMPRWLRATPATLMLHCATRLRALVRALGPKTYRQLSFRSLPESRQKDLCKPEMSGYLPRAVGCALWCSCPGLFFLLARAERAAGKGSQDPRDANQD
jgi:hypothetical protein